MSTSTAAHSAISDVRMARLEVAASVLADLEGKNTFEVWCGLLAIDTPGALSDEQRATEITTTLTAVLAMADPDARRAALRRAAVHLLAWQIVEASQ